MPAIVDHKSLTGDVLLDIDCAPASSPARCGLAAAQSRPAFRSRTTALFRPVHMFPPHCIGIRRPSSGFFIAHRRVERPMSQSEDLDITAELARRRSESIEPEVCTCSVTT